MPLPITLGTGRSLMRPRRPAQPPPPGPALVRDDFTTAVNPLVDSAAEPGPGTRDATGTLWKIINGRLRGGMQPTSPVWGNSKVVWDGQTRADGVTLWTIVNAANKDATFGVGWASSTAVTDPTTDGHHWLMNQGYGRVSQPSKQVTLVELNAGEVGMYRATEYLVGVTLRAQGAIYWMSGVAATPGGPLPFTTDRVGIPQSPTARILWIDDTTTTSPMYPHVGALNAIGHVDGNVIDDLRVAVVDDWATDAGPATFLDRFTRADSTTSVGPGWTNAAGTGGISSNQAYIVTAAGTRTFIVFAGAAASADGIWRWKVTVGATTTNQVECYFRYVDTTNYMRVQFSGGSAFLTNVTGGTEFQSSTPFTLSVGQVIDILVVTKGDNSRLYLNGDYKASRTDTGGSNRTGTGMGYGGWTLSGTTARWDDFMWAPNTVTLPAAIQAGPPLSIFTAGAPLMEDTFSGANGDPINGRTPDTTGTGTWTTVGTGWTIQSNTAKNSNVSGSTSYLAYFDCGAPDVEAALQFVLPTNSAAGLVLRYTNGSNYVVARVLGGAGGTSTEIEILEAFGGTEIVVKHQQIYTFFQVGVTYTLTAQIVGDVLHAFLDGIPIISYIVHVPNNNRHGIYHNSIGTTMDFDHITIKALS